MCIRDSVGPVQGSPWRWSKRWKKNMGVSRRICRSCLLYTSCERGYLEIRRLLYSQNLSRKLQKMKEKISYDDLVRRINVGLNGTTLYHDAFGTKPGKPLQEVNAWTYWQGYKVRNPTVMVVGQDWGSLNGSKHYLDCLLYTSLIADNVVY